MTAEVSFEIGCGKFGEIEIEKISVVSVFWNVMMIIRLERGMEIQNLDGHRLKIGWDDCKTVNSNFALMGSQSNSEAWSDM